MWKIYTGIVLILFYCVGVTSAADDVETVQTAIEKLHRAYTEWDIQGFKDVAELCEEVVARDPDNAKAWYWRGTALFFATLRYLYTHDTAADTSQGLRTIDQGIASLNEAIQINPDFSESYAIRGVLRGMRISLEPWSMVTHGPFVGKDRDMALKINPDNPRVHYLTGMSYWYAPKLLGGRQKALRHLLKAEQLFVFEASQDNEPLEPTWGYEMCLSFIGDFYREKKDRAKAEEYYTKALALNADDLVAQNGLNKLKKHEE
jgi:tetratricopeptide (TPR) repeat protein